MIVSMLNVSETLGLDNKVANCVPTDFDICTSITLKCYSRYLHSLTRITFIVTGIVICILKSLSPR